MVVGPEQSHCYQHDPGRAEERKRNAARGGKGKANPKLAKLDRQLEDLAADTLEGGVDRGVAAVVNQIINTRLRAIEIERKIKESEEIEARLSELERVLQQRGGHRWGA